MTEKEKAIKLLAVSIGMTMAALANTVSYRDSCTSKADIAMHKQSNSIEASLYIIQQFNSDRSR